jgi:predicted DCC family thiol-disulfide oxidoreductase YuxK
MNGSSRITVLYDGDCPLCSREIRFHGVLPAGTVIESVEVFRRAYAAVGLGWLMAPTRWPGLRRLADLAYRIFARNRLRPAVESTSLGSGR